MEKEFIPYEQALALKELGFDEPCLAMFTNRYANGEIYPKAISQHEGSNISGDKNSDFNNQNFWYVTSPTFSQAFRWFREKYKELKIFIKEEDFREGLYEYDIKDVLGVSGFKTYEEAELECLKKLIEIVK